MPPAAAAAGNDSAAASGGGAVPPSEDMFTVSASLQVSVSVGLCGRIRRKHRALAAAQTPSLLPAPASAAARR